MENKELKKFEDKYMIKVKEVALRLAGGLFKFSYRWFTDILMLQGKLYKKSCYINHCIKDIYIVLFVYYIIFVFWKFF